MITYRTISPENLPQHNYYSNKGINTRADRWKFRTSLKTKRLLSPEKDNLNGNKNRNK